MARKKVENGEGTPEQVVSQSDIDLKMLALPPDNGEQLAKELVAADKETIITNARAMVFDSANRPAEKPIDTRMGGLVKRTFKPMDWDKVLDRFDAWMALGDKRTDEQFIRKAHEEGPEILGLVQDVYVQVKFARDAWELDNFTMLGMMREQASDVLESEKAKKIRTKTITIDDVTAKAASMFPDEYAAQEKQRKQYAIAEERAKYCVERATIRCKHLDSMMHKLR